MASMFDDIYGENEIPNGFVDENGLVHNLQYMENGDTFDTVKQSDGSYLTKIYGPDNILKGKMLTDKHNNQKKIVYQKKRHRRNHEKQRRFVCFAQLRQPQNFGL